MDKAFSSVVLLSVVEIYGDFALRFYAQTNNITYLFHGIAGYVGVVFFLLQSLRHGNVLYVNGMRGSGRPSREADTVCRSGADGYWNLPTEGITGRRGKKSF